MDLVVDSGASATVVGKGGVRAVKASSPDPNKQYNMFDGSTIPNLGEKGFRALTDDSKHLCLQAQVPEAVKPLLSVVQIVHLGGKVVFSPVASYIECKATSGGVSRDNHVFKDGLHVLKSWAPRKQDAPFQGPA